MNEFDIKAAGWDQNQMHWDRSAAIVKELLRQVHVSKDMTAIEYGAGTGIASFLLKDSFRQIIMIDSSSEMVRIMNEKVRAEKALNLKPVLFDLEKEEWNGDRVNLVLTQMVLHHVSDLKGIFGKFHDMILPGGYLAIADLYPEDGSFHGEGFTGHKGFDTDDLADKLRNAGFGNISSRKCFTINKMIAGSGTIQYDVFLLIAFRAPENER